MERFIILQEMGKLNQIYTNEKWNIILGNKEISFPTPKTITVDVPGSDGTLDLTEAVTGETKYNDRTIKYPFYLKDTFKELPDKISEIANYIHGKKFKIFHWDDLDYYYIGRLSINEYKIDRAKGTFVIEATCEPYKYKKYITSYIHTIEGSKNILCPNERKRVVPIITTDSEMTIEFQGATYTISAGTHEILNIYFEKGIYELNITGNGTFKIDYQEASL